MNIQQHLQKTLKDTINNANVIDDLLPILKKTDLSLVKNFLKETIQCKLTTEMNTLYYQVLSIEDILYSDILTLIVTFIPIECRTLQFVNKQFRIHYVNNINKNSHIHQHLFENHHTNLRFYRDIYTSSSTMVTNPDIPSEIKQTQNTFIVGLTYSFQQALVSAKDGDTILVQPGNYNKEHLIPRDQYQYGGLIINKSIKIIGYGKNVNFNLKQIEMQICNTVYFENINFNVCNGIIVKKKESVLFMYNCFIGYYDMAIKLLTPHCSIDIKLCTFYRKRNSFWDIIWRKERGQHIKVNSCMFIKSYNPDIIGKKDSMLIIKQSYASMLLPSRTSLTDNIFIKPKKLNGITLL